MRRLVQTYSVLNGIGKDAGEGGYDRAPTLGA